MAHKDTFLVSLLSLGTDIPQVWVHSLTIENYRKVCLGQCITCLFFQDTVSVGVVTHTVLLKFAYLWLTGLLGPILYSILSLILIN